MKKVFAIMVMVVVSLSLSMAAFAGDEEKVKGTVTKIDQAAKSVTITTKDNQVVTVVYDDASLLSKVKEGEKGEARYTTKDGKNTGVKLRKLTEGCQ